MHQGLRSTRILLAGATGLLIGLPGIMPAQSVVRRVDTLQAPVVMPLVESMRVTESGDTLTWVRRFKEFAADTGVVDSLVVLFRGDTVLELYEGRATVMPAEIGQAMRDLRDFERRDRQRAQVIQPPASSSIESSLPESSTTEPRSLESTAGATANEAPEPRALAPLVAPTAEGPFSGAGIVARAG